MPAELWRVGRHVPHHIYRSDGNTVADEVAVTHDPAVAAQIVAEHARVTVLEAEVEWLATAILSVEWRPARTMTGSTNLFCPVCGGCPHSAAMNPRTQRADGHMIDRYIYEGETRDGCPLAVVCDAARAALAVEAT